MKRLFKKLSQAQFRFKQKAKYRQLILIQVWLNVYLPLEKQMVF